MFTTSWKDRIFFLRKKQAETPKGEKKKKRCILHQNEALLCLGILIKESKDKTDREREYLQSIIPRRVFVIWKKFLYVSLERKTRLQEKKKNRYEIKSVMQNGICCLF